MGVSIGTSRKEEEDYFKLKRTFENYVKDDELIWDIYN